MYIQPPHNDAATDHRIKWVIRIILGVFFILVFRLFLLQIVKGNEFQSLAENNRVRLIRTRIPRGIIYDRNGVPLATNRRVFSIFFDPYGTSDKEKQHSFQNLVRLLLEKKAVVPESISKSANFTESFRPRKLAEDVDFTTVASVREQSLDLPGVYVKDELIRYYPLRGGTLHLLGYLRGITDSELQKPQFENYEMDDVVGQNGVEKIYEQDLRGQAGGWMIEVDSRGRKRRDIGNVPAIPGNSLVLNVDAKLQQKASELLAGKRGTIIAMDPNTGGILCMVSEPSYDPNLLSGYITGAEWDRIIHDPYHPLNNRAIMGSYPPGSIFKLVTSIAGLDTGKIKPSTTFYCPGYFSLGKWVFKCHKKEGHGTLNLIQGITLSCNVYFYHTAQLVGIQTLLDMASRFGIGRQTGVDLTNENKGLIPTKEWKRIYRKEGWYPGDTVQLGIGQGFLLVTPLQMVSMVATIANGGKVYRPYITKQIEDGSGRIIRQFNPQVTSEIGVSEEILQTVRKGMWGVVNSGGTGGLARLPNIEVAGKTGTAQNGEGGKDHAWFCGYAPFDKPQIAVLAMVEEGGFGGVASAPLAREIFATYFAEKNPPVSPTPPAPVAKKLPQIAMADNTGR